jgi:hypothetical protein
MTAAERLKKRLKGGVPHTTKKEKKEKFTHGGLYAETKFKKRKSGRNETNPGVRKRGFDF